MNTRPINFKYLIFIAPRYFFIKIHRIYLLYNLSKVGGTMGEIYKKEIKDKWKLPLKYTKSFGVPFYREMYPKEYEKNLKEYKKKLDWHWNLSIETDYLNRQNREKAKEIFDTFEKESKIFLKDLKEKPLTFEVSIEDYISLKLGK